MITYKTKQEIEVMKQGGNIMAKILQATAEMIQPGVSSLELETFVRKKIKASGAISAFLNYDTGYMGKYPAALCVSINSEVVHGIPHPKKIFKNGDIVGIDCGIWYKNLCVDSALTVGCGRVDDKAKKLIKVTAESLKIAITKCKIDNYTNDIGMAVQKYVESQELSIIKDLFGHGVGKKVHEDPLVPNFDIGYRGTLLKNGMTLAIEPMASLSDNKTKRGDDGYAAVTIDGSRAAHFEHTIAITKSGPVVLT